jgi:hypothetical protein
VTSAVALLFVLFGSVTAEDPISVSVITVPVAVPAFTLTTSEKFPVTPDARDAIVHVTVPVPLTAGVVQLQAAGLVSDWNVVLVGIASVKLTVVAVDGPLLVMDCVYVMLALGATVEGDAELVTEMSADAGAATSVFTVAVLFARFVSLTPELTESVSLMVVPLGVATPT